MRVVLGVLAVAFLSSCATPLANYTPMAAPLGAVAYEKNVPVTYSGAAGSLVAVSPPSGSDATQRPVFWIAVTNTSPTPITIGPENISVRTNDGRLLDVIPPEQLMREAQRSAFMTRLAAGLEAASNSMQAANAGYSNSSGTYSGTASAYGSGGGYAYGRYSGSYVGTQYNAAAAAQAQIAANAQNAQIASEANAQANAVIAGAQDGALQRQTIAPGTQYVTPVTVGRLPGSTTGLVMTVTVGADVHEFQWGYARQ